MQLLFFVMDMVPAGHDLVPLAPELIGSSDEIKNVRFIFPAAPLEIDPNYDGRAWWHIDIERIQELMARGEFREMSSSVPERLPLCREMIEQLLNLRKSNLVFPRQRSLLEVFLKVPC